MRQTDSRLHQLLAALRIERDEEYRQHQAYMQSHSLEQRVKDGYTWHPLEIKETGYGLGDYPFVVFERKKAMDEPHQFHGGNMVSIFSSFMDEEDAEAVGAIHWVDKNKMRIDLFGDEMPHWMGRGRMGVNLRFDEKTFREMEEALQFVIKSKNNRTADLRDLLAMESVEQKDRRKPEVPPEISPNLNASQQEAVRSVLASEDIAVIHGPPGTGKTTTLVEAIRQLALREEKTLVCAPSNAACDLLTIRLSDAGLNVVRIGNLSRIDEAVISHTLEGLLRNHPEMKTVKELKRRAHEFRDIAGKYKRSFGKSERDQRKLLYQQAKGAASDAGKIERALAASIIDKADAVITTLVGSSSSYLSDITFDTTVIDEAAQAVEPATWIPMMRAEKIVLAGDPCQLPPTIKSQEALKAGLGETLMETCIGKLSRVHLLEVQYRMHNTIMGFSNDWFYEGKLKAHENVGERLLAVATEFQLPLEFIDTAGCGFEEQQPPASSSYFNPDEGALLMRHLTQLTSQFSEEQIISIGVVSPYKSQVEHLRNKIAEDKTLKTFSGISVNTIDSFQGQERDVIYISLVRSNDRSEIGFLADYRRMNVAMTRAKMKLVIVGDSATLGSHDFYGKLIAYSEKNNAYRTAWEWMEW